MSRRGADRDLRARLRAAGAPGESAAADRALARVLEAHAATPVATPRRGPRPALVIAAVLLAVVIAAGLTSPGQAVGDWIREHVAPPPKPRPAPAVAVPGGRVLAVGS